MGRVQMRPRSEVEWKVARVASRTSNEQDVVAHAVVTEAKQRLAAGGHNKSGRYYEGLKVRKSVSKKHGIVDRVVEVDRDNVGPIEFGHFAGKRDTPNRKWVNGLFILMGAGIGVGNRVKSLGGRK